MKKLLKFGILSLTFFLTLVVNASEKINVEILASKSLKVSLASVKVGESISIIDGNGYKLFSEDLGSIKKYEKIFDLKFLPEGVYFLESNQESKIEVTPLLILNGKVSLLKDAVKEYNAPKITLKNNLVKVLLNNTSNATIKMSIRDNQGNILLREDEVETTNFYKKFDFSELPKGKYIISISQDNYNFEEDIIL